MKKIIIIGILIVCVLIAGCTNNSVTISSGDPVVTSVSPVVISNSATPVIIEPALNVTSDH